MSRLIDADSIVLDYSGLAYIYPTDCRAIAEYFAKQIRAMPTIIPERKRGRWVEIGDEPYDEWECDMCGFVIDGSGCVDPEEYRDVYHYCPNCGAKMTEGEE